MICSLINLFIDLFFDMLISWLSIYVLMCWLTGHVQDLIKYTPTGHADYDLLQKTLKLARRFLDNLVAPEADRDNVRQATFCL